MADFSTLLENLHQQFQASGISYQPLKGRPDNLFDILHVQNKEVVLCRFIGYLLNPSGGHGRGSAPLKAFLDELGVGACYSEESYRTAKIVLEDPIKDDRRVDLAIYIGKDVIPVEVKIDAPDQKAQLSDYYNFYCDHPRWNVRKIYYLTPNGREPSEESKQELTPEQYACISFGETIQNWLKTLPAQNDPYQLIKQFKEVIETMCREDVTWEKLSELLLLDQKPSEYLELLSTLLASGDRIWKELRKQYLLHTLQLGEFESTYQISEKEDTEKEEHCVLTVDRITDGQTVAWICVDTNLYIATGCQPKTESTDWTPPEKGYPYFWRFLSPGGPDQEFPLKKPNASIRKEDKIDLAGILKDVPPD